jgi:hypothetical protein
MGRLAGEAIICQSSPQLWSKPSRARRLWLFGCGPDRFFFYARTH